MLDFLVHLSSWLSGSPTYMLQNGAYAPKKKEMLREQAPGLDPASQSQPGHQGSPSTKGWFSPSWLLTAPVAGHSYLIWGKYALGSLWDGGMALYFPTPWLDVLWTASPRSTFKVQSASLSMVSHTLELSHLTNYCLNCVIKDVSYCYYKRMDSYIIYEIRKLLFAQYLLFCHAWDTFG